MQWLLFIPNNFLLKIFKIDLLKTVNFNLKFPQVHNRLKHLDHNYLFYEYIIVEIVPG